MAKELKFGLKIGADTGEAESNVSRFEKHFAQMLRDMGKTPKEIAAFHQLAADVAAGRKELWTLDEATQSLVKQYRSLSSVAKAQDILNLVPADEIKRRIASVNGALETLKKSGTLSRAEMAAAQAAAKSQIDEMAAGTGLLSQAWGRVGGTVKAVGAVGAGVAAGLGAGLAVSVKQAVEFESAMANVRKVVEATPEKFAALTEEIEALTRDLPQSAVELAAIAEAGGQLGVAADDIGKFTRLTAEMATAFNMSADEAGQAIAKLANVYSLPIDKVRELGDAINVLGNNSAATEAGIVEAMTRIGGTATQFGLTTREAAALSTAFISLGKTPEIAATGINALLSRLQTANVGSKELKEGLGQLGMSAEQLADQIAANPQQALTTFLRTLKDLDGQTRAEVLTQMFGQEMQDDISVMVGALGQYEQALGLVSIGQNNAGAMAKELGARMETAEAQLGLLKNALDQIARDLGKALLPAFKEIVGGAKDLVADLSKTTAGPDGEAMAEWARGIADGLRSLPEQFAEVQEAIGTTFANIARLRLKYLESTNLFGVNDEQIAKVRGNLAESEALIRSASDRLAAIHAEAAADAKKSGDAAKKAGEDAADGMDKAGAAAKGAGDAAAKAGDQAKTGGQAAAEGWKQAKEEAEGLERSAKSLGIDLKHATTQVTEGALDAATAMADLVQSVSRGGGAAEDVARVFREVWPKALAKATDPKDVEHLKATVLSLAESGDLTAAQVAEAFGKIGQAAKTAGDDVSYLTTQAQTAFNAQTEQAKRLAAEQEKATAATKDQAEALRDQGRAATGAASSVSDLADEFPAVAEASDRVKAKFAELIEENNRLLREGAQDMSLLGNRMLDVRAEAAAITAEYSRQQAAVAGLTARIQTGAVSTQEAAREALEAARAYDLLGAEDLTPLRQALEDAAQRAADLKAEAADTLASLRDELDQMNANYAAVERRRYEAQKADLEERRRLASDDQTRRDLDQALSYADQIHRKKMADIAAETAARQEQERASAEELRSREKAAAYEREIGTPLPGAGTETTAQRERASAERTGEFAPARTVRVEFGTGGPVGAFSESDASRLIAMLQDQAARSLSA